MLVKDLPIVIEFRKKADKILCSMDGYERKRIMTHIHEFSKTGTPAPQALTGQLKGYYKLRFGDMRVIVSFSNRVCYIEDLGNRGNIYKK